MKEAISRDAAAAVTEAVTQAAYDLDEALLEIRKALEAGPPRRDRWAGELFARMLGRAYPDGRFDEVKVQRRLHLAKVAWELADALDECDPQKKRAGAARPGGDGGAGDPAAAADDWDDGGNQSATD